MKSFWLSVSIRSRFGVLGKRAFQLIFVRSGVWSKVMSRWLARIVEAVSGPVRKARSSTLPFACVLTPFSDVNVKRL